MLLKLMAVAHSRPLLENYKQYPLEKLLLFILGSDQFSESWLRALCGKGGRKN